MKKFLNWICNHIVLTATIFNLTVAVIVAGVFTLSHRGNFNDELAQYEAIQEVNKMKYPALPKKVIISNGYVTYGDDTIVSSQSSYENKYLYFAKDATVAPLSESVAEEYKKIDETKENKLNEYITSLDRFGGAITFKIEAAKAGYADVVVEMRTNWKNAEGEYLAYENITDNIKIQFNKLEIKTENMTLPADRNNFTSFVLQDVLLLEGINTLTITSSAYNPYKSDSNKILYIVPDIRNVAVMANVEIKMPEAA